MSLNLPHGPNAGDYDPKLALPTNTPPSQSIEAKPIEAKAKMSGGQAVSYLKGIRAQISAFFGRISNYFAMKSLERKFESLKGKVSTFDSIKDDKSKLHASIRASIKEAKTAFTKLESRVSDPLTTQKLKVMQDGLGHMDRQIRPLISESKAKPLVNAAQSHQTTPTKTTLQPDSFQAPNTELTTISEDAEDDTVNPQETLVQEGLPVIKTTHKSLHARNETTAKLETGVDLPFIDTASNIEKDIKALRLDLKLISDKDKALAKKVIDLSKNLTALYQETVRANHNYNTGAGGLKVEVRNAQPTQMKEIQNKIQKEQTSFNKRIEVLAKQCQQLQQAKSLPKVLRQKLQDDVDNCQWFIQNYNSNLDELYAACDYKIKDYSAKIKEYNINVSPLDQAKEMSSKIKVDLTEVEREYEEYIQKTAPSTNADWAVVHRQFERIFAKANKLWHLIEQQKATIQNFTLSDENRTPERTAKLEALKQELADTHAKLGGFRDAVKCHQIMYGLWEYEIELNKEFHAAFQATDKTKKTRLAKLAANLTFQTKRLSELSMTMERASTTRSPKVEEQFIIDQERCQRTLDDATALLTSVRAQISQQ